jgi:hypothetical protein
MKIRTSSKMKWLSLALLAGLTSCAIAEEPVARYEIGWDDGDGDYQNGRWHTVPKLIQGTSTIHFTNQGVKSEVQTGADGIQVFKTEIETLDADLLAFTELSSSGRHYVVKGEARWENLSGWVDIAMGVSNSNYAGTVGAASTADGKNKWTGTHEWQPFSLACDLPPATRPAGSTEPNQFIAEMGLKRSGIGVLYIRNLRLEVYGKDFSAAAHGPASLIKSFSVTSFGSGLGAGVLCCLAGVHFHATRRKTNHERELRRIASLDVPQN